MKKIVLLSAIFIVIILILLASAGGYYGLFTSIEVKEERMGPFLLVYEKHIGDYKETGAITDRIYKDLKNNYALNPTKGFGLYYDNPKEVKKEKLRSMAGCILDSKYRDRIAEFSKKYHVQYYPRLTNTTAYFPYKGKPSILIGVFKVYPKLTKYAEQKGYPKSPMMEIYDIPNKQIIYIGQTGFFPSFRGMK